MPAIDYVDRNETNESQVSLSPRRCSQRKSTATIAPLVNGKAKSSLKRNENMGWLVDDSLNEGEKKIEVKVVKRGKRSLTIEKDKLSPRSVKVLRRSHAQSSAVIDAKSQKLNVSVIKNANKTI